MNFIDRLTYEPLACYVFDRGYFDLARLYRIYPGKIRRIVYYAPELLRTFTYYTNNFYIEAKDIALLYKYRWQVELFFESWAVLCSPRMTLRNFSFRLKKTTKQMMDSLRLILNSININ